MQAHKLVGEKVMQAHKLVGEKAMQAHKLVGEKVMQAHKHRGTYAVCVDIGIFSANNYEIFAEPAPQKPPDKRARVSICQSCQNDGGDP